MFFFSLKALSPLAWNTRRGYIRRVWGRKRLSSALYRYSVKCPFFPLYCTQKSIRNTKEQRGYEEEEEKEEEERKIKDATAAQT